MSWPTPKLLDRVRVAIRVRHYSRRTEECYVAWVKRCVRFHRLRHPDELGAAGVQRFLVSLADEAKLSASSQAQALSALLFLYRDVLQQGLGPLDRTWRAKQPARLPVVLGRDEVCRLLARLEGAPHTVELLLYGSGLRLLEALELRVKDVDFAMRQLCVRRARAAGTG